VTCKFADPGWRRTLGCLVAWFAVKGAASWKLACDRERACHAFAAVSAVRSCAYSNSQLFWGRDLHVGHGALSRVTRLDHSLMPTIHSQLSSVACGLFLAVAIPSLTAQSINVGSTGVDGVFNPQSDVVIDLATQGTYDPVQWRVVFNYTSVDVPAGVTVRFSNHPSRAPVVWLSQTDIVINGAVSVDGAAGWSTTYGYAEPGPGGFRGGRGGPPSWSWVTSSGFGVGGAFQSQSGTGWAGGGGGYGSNGASAGNSWGGSAYGDPMVTQLLGGSGGAPTRLNGHEGRPDSAGGAGGGAILLAANETITIGGSGRIYARGGEQQTHYAYSGGGGSGGSVRMVAQRIEGSVGSTILATGGYSWNGPGGVGRVRFEANDWAISGFQTSPAASTGMPGPIVPLATTPTACICEIGGVAATADPRAALVDGPVVPDVALSAGNSKVIVIETTYVPLNATVYLRVTGASGPAQQHLVTDGATNPLVELVPSSSDLRARVSITLNLPQGYTALQARVVLP
jgi:hypothetical protein